MLPSIDSICFPQKHLTASAAGDAFDEPESLASISSTSGWDPESKQAGLYVSRYWAWRVDMFWSMARRRDGVQRAMRGSVGLGV